LPPSSFCLYALFAGQTRPAFEFIHTVIVGAESNADWPAAFNSETLSAHRCLLHCCGSPIQPMPANLDPDAALMLRVKQGDTAAFTELVDKYKQPVMNLACRTLRDATEAEDLAQNVFVQVYKSAHRYKVAAKFSTWLFTIARNLCLNEIRRRSRHPAESLDAPHPEQEDQPLHQFEDRKSVSPPANLLQGELEEKIAEVLAGLPENQRTAILLCRQEELSYEEIAEVLGCSLSATKSLIHRGRETLKEKLKPYLRSGQWGGPE
jgi:RNA polymerase sigma-70 factor, ECF subfamily